MISKLLAGALALAFSLGEAGPSPFRYSFAVIPQLECASGKGTGIQLDGDRILTAAHVATRGPCGVNGVPVTTEFVSPDRDIAVVKGANPYGVRAILSCDGIAPGERYLAAGYALGGPPNIEPLVGTTQRQGDAVVMRGRVYPGMSGGPVIDSDGRVVGVIVRYFKQVDFAAVIPISETYLCRPVS